MLETRLASLVQEVGVPASGRFQAVDSVVNEFRIGDSVEVCGGGFVITPSCLHPLCDPFAVSAFGSALLAFLRPSA